MKQDSLFGNLAIMASDRLPAVDPMALRLQLSLDLPLSELHGIRYSYAPNVHLL
jgi:hypothetical protein